MRPLGSRRDVRETLARFNTADDGATRQGALTEVLHGPGMVLELPVGQDEITQAMVNVQEEDIAWSVLSRLCKSTGWSLVDLETGRKFSG